MAELTGQLSHRVQQRWFRRPLLILQVEEEYIHSTWNGGSVDCERAYRWRDATVQDIFRLKVRLELKKEGEAV